MKLIEIYRIALARGLTAKEAGAEFNVKHDSIHKVGSKHKLPKLTSEYDKEKIKQMQKMSTAELKAYLNMLEECVVPNLKELTICMAELEKRKES
jgi:hypothetical protein